MLSRFFVNRPIFAWVIAIVIMLAGALASITLPVSQYPNIAPPQIRIWAQYPGANAETVARTVTQIIEENMTGLDGMLYMSSQSDSVGTASIRITFEAGTNPDIAQVQVQNKLSVVEAKLPESVRRIGITVEKSAPSFLMAFAFYDKTGKLTGHDLGDFLINNIKEPISRVQGVGDVQCFGASYAMRIWVDPDKLFKYNLQPSDVVNAVAAQNVQVAAGDVGGAPVNQERLITAKIRASSLMERPEQFEQIALVTKQDGTVVRIKDVARVELGSQSYQFDGIYKGQSASGMAISLAGGANAKRVAADVQAKLEELRPFFPEGVELKIVMDTTRFVDAAMHEVIKTLIEAIFLVVFVMYLFLQNARATIIPTIAVPVVLLGTLAVMGLLGFSINMLTMFGLVLAIGLLVDDAIVVVENVERVMDEDRSDPHEATVKSMQQITGALVGIAMVLSAVFIPMAFFGGSTGVIYRQFSVTIVSAMLLSVVVAVTLTPALCASILRQRAEGEEPTRLRFFMAFNHGFHLFSRFVCRVAHGFSRRIKMLVVIYGLLLALVVWGFAHLPSSFMPQEDQGVLLFTGSTPPSATAGRTDAVLRHAADVVLKQESDNIESTYFVRGFSFGGTGETMALGFMELKDWSVRKKASQAISAIQGRVQRRLFGPDLNDLVGYVFPLPAVPELGVAEGFDFFLEDRTGLGHDRLMEVMGDFLRKANSDPRLTMVRHNGMDDVPLLELEVDYDKARAMGISNTDINNTLSIAFGSSYVNDFMDRGRIKKVYVQGDANSRGEQADIAKWHVRNNKGELVSFDAFSSIKWGVGAGRLERFNAVDAVNIQGQPRPGYSSGEAMKAVEEILAQMPKGYSIEWNALSYQERAAGNNAAPLYAISLLVVFLALAALYESWTIPIAVILVVPLGVLGALGLTAMTGRENDVYFQVGLLTTVGLVAKNAILIVEFARDLYDSGRDLLEAVVEAVRLRLRPILMTSIAFGLGVFPLAVATGAGAGAQSAIGIAVLGGMLTGTFLCIFFVPVFFVLINKIFGRKRLTKV